MLYDVEITMIAGWWKQIEGPRPPAAKRRSRRSFKHYLPVLGCGSRSDLIQHSNQLRDLIWAELLQLPLD